MATKNMFRPRQVVAASALAAITVASLSACSTNNEQTENALKSASSPSAQGGSTGSAEEKQTPKKDSPKRQGKDQKEEASHPQQLPGVADTGTVGTPAESENNHSQGTADLSQNSQLQSLVPRQKTEGGTLNPATKVGGNSSLVQPVTVTRPGKNKQDQVAKSRPTSPAKPGAGEQAPDATQPSNPGGGTGEPGSDAQAALTEALEAARTSYSQAKNQAAQAEMILQGANAQLKQKQTKLAEVKAKLEAAKQKVEQVEERVAASRTATKNANAALLRAQVAANKSVEAALFRLEAVKAEVKKAVANVAEAKHVAQSARAVAQQRKAAAEEAKQVVVDTQAAYDSLEAEVPEGQSWPIGDWRKVSVHDRETLIAHMLMEKINSYREKAGLRPLVANHAADHASRTWAQFMAQEDNLIHASDLISGMDLKYIDGLKYIHAENIAWVGGGKWRSPLVLADEVFDAWKKSEWHNKNMLRDWSYQGLGVATTKTGGIYVAHRLYPVGELPESDSYKIASTRLIAGVDVTGDITYEGEKLGDNPGYIAGSENLPTEDPAGFINNATKQERLEEAQAKVDKAKAEAEKAQAVADSASASAEEAGSAQVQAEEASKQARQRQEIAETEIEKAKEEAAADPQVEEAQRQNDEAEARQAEAEEELDSAKQEEAAVAEEVVTAEGEEQEAQDIALAAADNAENAQKAAEAAAEKVAEAGQALED
ncbi:CAP domain-containing protein [Winkia sp. UMB3158]|uniref:CAP domain-containing protein n=2 Tax=Bacillati TaxID=1783272 RepID=A0AB38XLZ8_9ACTO|nr:MULTISPECIES: CAP domain-containing protein [Winkia]MDK8342446.1 CAP domain-containing protein [Winkia sp. UMB3164B]OFT39261.1 hypothetical protein HMPREF3163_03030 [Actinomyces sp. HMSC08A01]PMC93298.1 hypothetical protein CJ188_05855 [Actinomyces sp. UMB0918]MDK7149491.1 CAP domain-containing protein [Winkia sp. UMB3158]MDK7184674.1 CAP domain-containing protein [Winkia sp. UMB1295B]